MTAATPPELAFRFRASNDEGTVREGVIRASSRDDALRELRRQSLWPVSVEAVQPSARTATWSTTFGARRPAVALWTRTLATLVGAGASMDRALQVAAAQVDVPAVRRAVTQVHGDVRGGASLASAMRAHPTLFDALHVGMVDAGEMAGQLPNSLDTLAGYLEEDEDRRAQLRSALLYPALMAVVSAIGVLVLLLFVVPRFAGMLADVGGTLPWSTRVLVALGAGLARFWWLMLIGIAVAVVAFQQWVASSAGRLSWGRLRLQLPVIGTLERSISTARFTRALGLMLRGGGSLLPAVRLARNSVTNPALAADLDGAIQRVARGDGLANSTAGILTPLATQLLTVGEESAQLEQLATRAADAHDDAARRTLRTLSSLLEPALVLTFGAIVGFVALAMLQAIYAVNVSLPS
jgi:general secretion pathway protein F